MTQVQHHMTLCVCVMVAICIAGFAAIQWWASLGLVACYWTAGEDQEAKAYYSLIEGMLGDR